MKFAQMFGLYLSTYILVLIGLDRLMAVKFPLKIIDMGRKTRTRLIVAYSLSTIFSIPQVCYLLPPQLKHIKLVLATCFN